MGILHVIPYDVTRIPPFWGVVGYCSTDFGPLYNGIYRDGLP